MEGEKEKSSFRTELDKWVGATSVDDRVARKFKISLTNQDINEKNVPGYPNEQKEGRAAIIEFPLPEDSQQDPLKFENNPAEFKTKLLESLDKKCRRLIILENLGYDWVEILAILLKVPLDFFAQHWATPVFHTNMEAGPALGEDAHHHFILSYDQFHDITIKGPKQGTIYRLRGTAYRNVVFEVDEGGEDGRSRRFKKRNRSRKGEVSDHDPLAVSQQLVSYLGIEDSENSWTAILLVDPPLSKHIEAGIYTLTSSNKRPEWEPWEKSTAKLPLLPKLSEPKYGSNMANGGTSKDQQANDSLQGKSMFEDLLKATVRHSLVPHKPWDATWACRRLVMAKSAATVRKVFTDTVNLQTLSATNLDWDDIASLNFDDFDNNAWDLEWQGRRFTLLWKQREGLELLRYNLQRNIQTMQKLTLPELDPIPWPKTVQNLRDEKKAGPTQDNLEADKFSLSVRYQDRIDLREWNDLARTAEYLDQMVQRTTDSYLQTVAACNAQASSVQAKGLGRITKMASVFVPVSLVAAIFAMAGNFEAGQSKFWVFWAVSMPIMITLILWMFGKDVKDFFKEVLEKILGAFKNGEKPDQRLKLGDV